MDFSTINVLVVEDHDFQRRMALQMLKGLGVTCLHESGDGRGALELLHNHPTKMDIVICDLDMPEMDGIEFIRHVAERKLVEALVVASGLDSVMLNTVESMAKAYGMQVLGVLEKPLTAKRLNEVLGYYQAQAIKRDANGPMALITPRDLRNAIHNREMVPHFQPKIDLSSGKVFGVEALVRWQRSDGSWIPPGAFIPMVEQQNLIADLTELIFDKSCATQKEWRDQGLDLNVAINVSLLNLTDIGVADNFIDIVRRHGGHPKQITIEITESSVMQEAAKALNVLARLRLKGFALAIDDFGTGYSSMQQLSQLPFTELKIDQSFVRSAHDQPRRRTMVETSLELARKLKLKAVAEGCETRAEWDLLVALGCDLIQGWYIAKAMPGHEIPEWVNRWRPPVT